MRGALLDKRGRVEGYAAMPRSAEVTDWTSRVERRLAEERTRDLLTRAERDGPKMTTTTNRYLAHPAAAAGISRASSGGAAWSFSASTDVVAASAITSTFYIAGFTWCWHTPAAVVDTTYEVLFELMTGAGDPGTLIIQVPSSFRADTLVGYVPSNMVIFPEPKQVAANTQVRVRVAQSLATTSQTYTAIKILYQTA